MYVEGFGHKGEGKAANYGVAIPPPTVVALEDLPFEMHPSSSASEVQVAAPSESPVPPPLMATSEQVEEWVATEFSPLTNISTNLPPSVGETVLWRGVKTGRRGHPSTKVEHFQGRVCHVEVDADHEVYLYVD